MKYFDFGAVRGSAMMAVVMGAAAFGLSGCLGSSSSSSGGSSVGGGGAVSAPTPGSLIGNRQAPDLAQTSQLAGAILATETFDGEDGPRIASLLTDIAAAGSAPTPDTSALAGTASYAGDFIMQEINDGDTSILGDFAMSVDFDNGNLTGTLGSQAIVDDGFDRDVATGTGTINGTVMGNAMTAAFTGAYSGADQGGQIDGRMDGQFVGTGAETVAGGMTAAVRIGGETTVFDGGFAGTRAAP